jgi:hypothetical protein
MTHTSVPRSQVGKELFFDPVNDRSCGVCHRVQDSGGKVGPALDGLAKKPEKEILAYLRLKLASEGKAGFGVRTASGETICGIKAGEDAARLQIYDVTATGPPVLRTFSVGDIVAREDCAGARVHAGFSGLYTPAQLSNIAVFLKSNERRGDGRQ